MEGSISQSHPNDNRQAERYLPRTLTLVALCHRKLSVLSKSFPSSYKINLHILNLTGPPIEPKNLIGEVDDLLRSKIMNFSTTITRSRRYVFRSELLVESALQCCYLLCGIFVDSSDGFLEWICRGGCCSMLFAWSSRGELVLNRFEDYTVLTQA